VGQEVGHHAGVQRPLPLVPRLQQRQAAGVEAAVQRRQEAEGGREQLRLLRGDRAGDDDAGRRLDRRHC